MPTLFTKDGASAVFETPEEVQAALATGEWVLPESGRVGYTTPTGRNVELAPEALANMPGHGHYGVQSGLEGAAEATDAAVHSAYSGVGDQLLGAAEGAGSVLSFGLTDLGLDALGADTALREKHTVGRTVGEIAGVVGSIAVGGGLGAGTSLGKALARTPAGMLTKAAAAGKTPLARIAMASGEGAAYGVGQAVSNIALAEPGVTAEQVVSEIGQGALLGAALGGAGGAFGEGIRKIAASRAATAPRFDLGSTEARGVMTTMAKSYRNIDDAVDFAVKEEAAVLSKQADDIYQAELGAFKATKEQQKAADAAASTAREAERVATAEKAYQANPLRSQLDEMRASRDELEQLIAARGENGTLNAAEPLIRRMNAIALKVGDARLPPVVWDDLADAVLTEGGVSQGRQLTQLVKRADGLTKKFEKMIRSQADEAAGKHMASRAVDEGWALPKPDLKAPKRTPVAAPPKPKRPEVFGGLPGKPLGTDGVKSLLKQAEKDPEGFLKSVTEIGDYYKAAQAATAKNPRAAAVVKDSIDEITAALDNMIPKDARATLGDPQTIAAILGISAGAEVVLPDGPAQDILHVAAALKLLGGMRMGGRSMGLGKRMVRAITRRAGAGAASGAMRSLPYVQKLGPAAQTAAVGGGASFGYEATGAAQRFLDRMTKGTRSAVVSQSAVDARISGAIERTAKGKPSKARVMPGLTLVLDKLLGDIDPPKSTKEKFKVIQDRLAKYAVAPDAALNSVYELLRPVQEVSEQLADMMESTFGAQIDYLVSKMPLDPGTMVMFGKSMWSPSDRELYEFGLYAMGVLLPLDVADMIADGVVPPQAAEALATTNPEIFAKLQVGIIERADEVRENSTYNQRIALGLAFQLPLDPTTDPRYVAFMQDMHAQKTMEQAAGSSGEGSTPEESYSDAQKLLS